ncbi:MAG: HTTM domain-containing protein [Candidatus Omnitrophica bacterium]|nr:HTTM domain-containing protein [Candidatus Omnitrophota bacterium]MCB9721497.1 HTTM domain-containing protein [Candidatus Omnitrophota bacterium]
MGETVNREEGLSEFLSDLRRRLMTPVDPLNLGMFRILFGLVLIGYFSFYRTPAILNLFYLSSDFHFSYPLRQWLHLPVPTAEMLLVIHRIMLAGAGLLVIGLFTRAAAAVLLLTSGYLFLLEKAVYAHHDYLILLFLLLFVVTGPGPFLAADRLLFRKPSAAGVPAWTLFLFRAQVVIIYFFSALNRINGEWLSGRVAQSLFTGAGEAFVFAAVVIGLLADMCLAFMLTIRALRPLALIILIAFNIGIKYYLDMTILPFLMISTATLFVNPVWIRHLGGAKGGRAAYTPEASARDARVPGPAWAFICVYLFLQMTIPLRHFLIPGPVQWNMLGERFSWRIFSQVNVGHIDFFVTDIITGKTEEVPRLTGINPGSYLIMNHHPDMILEYADYLRERYAAKGIYAPLVSVNSFASTNGRPFSLFINPELNIAHAEIGPYYPILINPTGLNQPSTRIFPRSVGKFFAAPYQLAVIDEEELLPGDHPLVKEMEAMIDRLVDTEIISPYQVSNLIVETQQILYTEYGRFYTTHELLQGLLDKYGHLDTMPSIDEVTRKFIHSPSS